jgi:glycine/D-amino acid oxidase-like deaminating enzyme
VTSILDTLREQHPGTFSIETFTPVRSIESNSSGYQVRLDRGTINCLFVVHCTNGYVGHLLPSLRSAIVPVRGQMTAQSPGANFTNEGVRHSWTFVHRRGYDYMTQSGETGSIFLGGGLLNGANDGLDDFGNSDDSRESQLSILHLGGLLPAMFGSRHWGAGGDDRMKASWTGIMGWSADGLPWVGQIPPAIAGREVAPGHGGEWLAGGFSGEGMVSAWRSAEAVVAMMLKEEDISGWFPEQFLVSEERLSQADPNTLLGLCM